MLETSDEQCPRIMPPDVMATTMPEHRGSDIHASVLQTYSDHASTSSTRRSSSLPRILPYLAADNSFSSVRTPRSRSLPPCPDMTWKATTCQTLHESHHDRHHAQDIPTTVDGLYDGSTAHPPNMAREQSSSERSPTMTAVPEDDADDVHPRPPISLPELSQILRLQKYQKRRAHHAEQTLHHLQVAAARTSRLVHAARSIQHTMAECIKSEDKPSFVNLLHAFQDATDRSLLPTSSVSLEQPCAQASDPEPTASFLEELRPTSRTSVLELLSKIRYSGSFLADRLACLSHKDLLALLADRTAPRPNESVLAFQSGAGVRASRQHGYVVDDQVDALSSFAYGSPLEALVLATQAVTNSTPLEDERTTRIWATVCAKLIHEQKPGSERLVPAIFDIWTSLYPWPGKARLEIWIQQTLQEGAFLLEHAVKSTFRARVEGRSDISEDEEMKAERFYSEAAKSLLDLLGDRTGLSVLPPGALSSRALPHFLTTRWLFSSFVSEAVSLPEKHGLLSDQYISDIARQRILREVAVRCQRAVFDVAYSWKYGNTPPVATTQRVNAIMARFQARNLMPTTAPHLGQPIDSADTLRESSETILVVSAKDVLMCLRALYPQRRSASIASDGDDQVSGVHSSSSSVSGFSLFRHSVESQTGANDTMHTSGVLPLQEDAQLRPTLEDCNHRLTAAKMLEAYLELEDVVASHSTATSELWDVIHAGPCTESLELMRVRPLDPKVEGVAPPGSAKPGMQESRSKHACAGLVELLLREHESTKLLVDHGVTSSTSVATQTKLEQLFAASTQACEDRSDFVGAHQWHRHFHAFRSFLACSSPGPDALLSVLERVRITAQESIRCAEFTTTACEERIRLLDLPVQLRSIQLHSILAQHDRLRDKLWYVADVRTTAAYEEVRSIATALRVMGKPKRHSRTRLQPPLRHWNTSKLSGSSKTDAQILEILSVKPEHGGPNKLSDDQSRTIELWMDRQNIDNICKGEERLHKLCMEVRKCVDAVMSAPVETSTIWSNTLFAKDAAICQQTPLQKKNSLFPMASWNNSQHGYVSMETHLRNSDALSSTSRTLSSNSSRDLLDAQSPTLTNKSSVPFWSPTTTDMDCASSVTSVNSSRTESALHSSPRKQPARTVPAIKTSLDTLRQHLISLMLSDLTSVLFSDGSETDRAFWHGLGGTLTTRYFDGLHAMDASVTVHALTTDADSFSWPCLPRFDFDAAFTSTLSKFSATSNPWAKLTCLYDIDRLLIPYMAEQTNSDTSSDSFMFSEGAGLQKPKGKINDISDIGVRGFRDLFVRKTRLCSTMFRDLQYIASLLPSSVLQETPEGKAFCNAAVAIASLKQEARSIMVETADSIIAYHSNNRGHGKSSSTAQQERDSATFAAPTRTPSAEDIGRYSMADAAYLLQITAKEGDAVAQRELATLYLTHPELMDPVLAPFSRPKDVFKDDLESRWRKNQDPNRCDPATMCVAHHWMSLSSKGGDSLAKEYLRQREEMDSF